MVGGDQSGEYIQWTGLRPRINRDIFVLHRAYFTNGTNREYYVKQGLRLEDVLDAETVERIEVCE